MKTNRTELNAEDPKINTVRFEEVEDRLLTLREQQMLLDADVAELYGVETRRINEAVKNNPERFPEGYIYELSKTEKQELVENFDRFRTLKHSPFFPKAFTEKGLYMLATILKSKQAVQTTLAIVETFTKLRVLNRTVTTLATAPKEQQKSLIQKTGDLVSEVLDDGLVINESETTLELNFAVLKLRHTIKKKPEGSLTANHANERE